MKEKMHQANQLARVLRDQSLHGLLSCAFARLRGAGPALFPPRSGARSSLLARQSSGGAPLWLRQGCPLVAGALVDRGVDPVAQGVGLTVGQGPVQVPGGTMAVEWLRSMRSPST